MSVFDVNVLLGHWPFRRVSPTSAGELLALMDRVGIERALVGSIEAITYRNCHTTNRQLFDDLRDFGDRLIPVPTLNPAYPDWEGELDELKSLGAFPAVRMYPGYHGYGGDLPALDELLDCLAGRDVPVILTTRLEDARQRHRLDTVPDLSGALVRDVVRQHPDLKVLVTNADSDLVKEILLGLPPEHWSRLRFDIPWILGPVFDHLKQLIDIFGLDPFVFGSGMAFKIPESAIQRVEMLELGAADREKICGSNAERFI